NGGTKSKQATGRGPVSLGPRWRGDMQCRFGDDRAWASFELPEEFAADLDEFKLHPALMDAATSYALGMVDRGGTFYLPFSYERVRIHGPLSRKIHSYARLREESAPEKGIISFDIVVTDDNGAELVEVEAFTMKKVGGVDIRNRSNGARPTQAEAPSAGAKAASSAEAILPKEGVEVFRRLLSKHVPPEVIVSPVYLPTRLEQARSLTSSTAVERMEKKAKKAKASHPRPQLKTPYVAPESDLEKDIAEVWQGVLGISEIGVNDNFLELGGHSLIAIQIVHRLRDAYKINLPMDAVFKSLTVAELAPLILNALTEQADEDMLSKLLDDIEQLPE
ncbi:MAG TPA: polyketide synthase dehydratase domain-containing protein, partial [Blastocatellia bacterium]|nr:polyketide synthase dehydratase domain-containing protein [Blastocatellia bacterium]